MCRWQDNFALSLYPVPRLRHARLLSPHFWVMNLFSFTLILRVEFPDKSPIYTMTSYLVIFQLKTSQMRWAVPETTCAWEEHTPSMARHEHAATANYYFCPTINIQASLNRSTCQLLNSANQSRKCNHLNEESTHQRRCPFALLGWLWPVAGSGLHGARLNTASFEATILPNVSNPTAG